jgi:hypothetical protein
LLIIRCQRSRDLFGQGGGCRDHGVGADGHEFGCLAGHVGVADGHGVGGARCLDVSHRVAYGRRGCRGDHVRVRSCAAGVGWAVVMASTSWAVKVALTYLGRSSSAVASGSEIGTARGRQSGTTLAACGRVGLLQQRQLRSRGVKLLGYNRGAHPHRGTGYQVGCPSRSVLDREVRVIPALVAVRLRDRLCAPARGNRAARVGVDGQGYRSHLSDRRVSPALA